MSEAEARTHIEAAQRELDAALLALDGTTPPTPEGDFVAATDDLKQKLADAAPGVTLRLDVAGRWDMPEYVFSKPVTLVTDGVLPEGRITPELLAGPTLDGFLTMQADNVTLRGIRVQGLYPEGTLVTCGNRTTLDRCVLLGSDRGQHRGVRADASNILITGCHIANIYKDQDTQAVGGWDGCKDLIVSNCYLEASGENVLFGGSDAVSEDRMPCNITIEDCYMSKQQAWRGRGDAVCKNLFELKNARNVVVRRCKMEYSWEHGQTGFAVVLTPRNQDGGNPWATVEHVLIEDCMFTHLGSGVQVLGDDYTHPSGRMTDIEFRRCVFTDIDPWVWGGGGRQFQISRGPQEFRVVDCEFSGAHLNSCLTFEDPAVPMQGFVIKNTRMPSGEYGIKCSEVAMGTPTLDLYCQGYVWENMTIEADAGGQPIKWPPGTTVV